ncbi:MAG: GTPase HflX, partial [Rikenellaceae bacterium]|nr:GTPase HflX [Rikenellaceae bacterium]
MIEEKINNSDPEADPAKAVLVAVAADRQPEAQVAEYLDELEFLAETAGIESVRRFTQRLPMPNSRTYVGPGKLDEVIAYVKEHGIGTVIFDDELSPSQTRNIEKAVGRPIVDRTNLILGIFLQRATTAYARTQVELARYEYMLPRLTRLWTH